MNFAEVLKTLRKEKGISQQELANATGIKQSSIGMYEIGARMPRTRWTGPLKASARWIC